MEQKITDSQIEYTLEALFQSIKSIYSNDVKLLEYDVHEQSISYKIAHNFENILNSHEILSNNLSVDVEYNRAVDRPKEYTIEYENIRDNHRKQLQMDINNGKHNLIKDKMLEYIDEYIETKKMRPDIILHKRGTNDSNLIAIEIKKNSDNTALDKEKLKFLTKSGEHNYNYKLGLSLVLKDEGEYNPTFTFFVQNEYFELVKNKLKKLKKQIPNFIIWLVNTSSVEQKEEIK